MPKFEPQHTPHKLIYSKLMKGYLDAAEWLLDEEIDRNTVKGWSTDALREARELCDKFENEHETLLMAFYEVTDRGDEDAGHDLWLTRNGHGVGFWDRGAKDVGDRLTEAAHALGSRSTYINDDGYIEFDLG